MTGTHARRAGVFAKAAAYLIDSAIVGVPLLALLATIPLMVGDLSAGITGTRLALAFAAFAVWIALAETAAYSWASMRGGSRGTPGMRVARTRLVDSETWRPIGTGPALVRSLVFVPTALSVVGLILQAFARTGRGWHDKIVGSMTIAVQAPHALKRGAPEADTAAAGPDAEPGAADASEAADEESPEDPDAAAPSPRGRGAKSKAKGEPDASGVISSVPDFVRTVVAPPSAPATVITEIPDEDVLDTIAAVSAPAPHFEEAPVAAPSVETAEGESAPEADDDVDATRVSRPAAPAEDDSDATRRSAPAPEFAAALLTWDDGTVALVRGTTVFGRNPVAGDLEPADLMPISDTTRSLSKTHFAFVVEGGNFFVIDRQSTNGTEISSPDGTTVGAFPGTKTPVQPGDRLVIAQRALTIGRA